MCKTAVSVLFGLLMGVVATPAQDDTSHHRAVYAETNANQKKYRQVKGVIKDDPLVIELTGYLDGNDLRKVLVRVPGEDGDGFEEYYLEGGQLLFVYRTYQSEGRAIEDRFYFRDGKMFKWLDAEKKTVAPETPSFRSEEERLLSIHAEFAQALGGSGTTKQNHGSLQGTFRGIEQGDYFHWNMEDKNGKPRTFFILKPDDSLDPVIDHPEAYLGKKCQIRWKKSVQKIPEGGGNIPVEEILSVVWTSSGE